MARAGSRAALAWMLVAAAAIGLLVTRGAPSAGTRPPRAGREDGAQNGVLRIHSTVSMLHASRSGANQKCVVRKVLECPYMHAHVAELLRNGQRGGTHNWRVKQDQRNSCKIIKIIIMIV